LDEEIVFQFLLYWSEMRRRERNGCPRMGVCGSVCSEVLVTLWEAEHSTKQII